LTLPVRVSEEAEAEMAEAARWYETHRAGLGKEFLDAVDTAVERIAQAPQIGSLVPGVSDQSIRRRPVRRFPYHVASNEPAGSSPLGSSSSPPGATSASS
jgi:plasmid stabilization system protein ParE